MDAKVSHKPRPCPSFKILKFSTFRTYKKKYVSIISMSNFFYFVESL
jgi:hypothetical protein